MSQYKAKIRFMPNPRQNNTPFSMDIYDEREAVMKSRNRNNKLMKIMELHGPLEDVNMNIYNYFNQKKSKEMDCPITTAIQKQKK